MNSTLTKLQYFFTSEDGPTAVEYAVVVGLIIVVCVAGITAFGGALNTWFTNLFAALTI